MPAIDELIVENNRMPTLPARAFGALQVRGKLLHHFYRQLNDSTRALCRVIV